MQTVRKGEEEQGARALYAMTCVLLGGAAALLCCLAFLLLCTAGVSRGLLGEGSMGQLAVCACVLGAFVGGLLAVRRFRARGLIVGACTGAVLFLLLLTVGVLFYQNMSPGGSWLALLCGSLCGGALAGLLGRKTKKKRHK